mgnify:CR=1 FL=1
MKKKFGFHIVKEKKDPTEEIADDIIDELQDSQNPMREMELKIKAHRYRFFRRVVIVAVSVVVCVGGSYYTLGSYPAIAFRAFRVTSTAVSLSAITGR